MISLPKPMSVRQAFTVLELMIALALLGALLAVAWSILGSYRLAEQRGWDQAYRLQIVRTTRELLETDVAHWDDVRSHDSFAANPELDALSAAFVGDENGFTIVMLPSLDPLPWLEKITASAGTASTPDGENANDAKEHRTDRIGGPLDRVQLKYEIVRDASDVDSTAVSHLRRQLTSLNRPSSSTAVSEVGNAADRVLTVDDLYRRNETDGLKSTRTMDSTLVRNLVAPRFRYGNGSEWFSQWDGREHGGLPRAIELSFDHPQANSPYRVTVDRESNAAFGPAGEAEASHGADQSDIERDVRIVVHVPAGIALRPSAH